MELLGQWVAQLNGIVWGIPMLVLILGTGLYLMLGLRLLPLRKLGLGFATLWRGRTPAPDGKGDISPFNALMTALSATVGTGNIAGVATAIALGGPGAVFWMWCTALVGMATKYAEAVCAVQYREVDANGSYVGGPMYYIKNGLGKRWAWLGTAFAIFGMLAGFGIGNTVQSNSVADALYSAFAVPPWISGLVMAVLVAAVLLGGIRRLAAVAGQLVPLMAVVYVGGSLVILLVNFSALPDALSLIIHHAFNPMAAAGGFAGATLAAAIQFGVARGVFSNEAGLGSAPMAHASATTTGPVEQGIIAMLGTFIDTLVICTATALVIIVSGTWLQIDPATGKALTGSALSMTAFNQALPGFGSYVVTFGLVIFAFTTLLGWSLYGERCVEYLFGVRAIIPFRLLWVLAVPAGALLHEHLNFVWLVADTLNALMALPNLIALLALSPLIFRITQQHFSRQAALGR